MRIFISYSSKDRDLAKVVADDLTGFGNEIWFDRKLIGGHEWWEDILSSIRICDLFVFVLSHESLESYPCGLEYKYAYALQKRILPILIADVNVTLLPQELSKIQYIDYRQQDKQDALALARALGNLPTMQPLPQPPPEPPPVPISPLSRLTERVNAPTLSFQEQTTLLFELKAYLADPANAENSRFLLKRLQNHPNLLATVDREISSLLANSDEMSYITRTSIKSTKQEKAIPTPVYQTPKTTPSKSASSSDQTVRYIYFICFAVMVLSLLLAWVLRFGYR